MFQYVAEAKRLWINSLCRLNKNIMQFTKLIAVFIIIIIAISDERRCSTTLAAKVLVCRPQKVQLSQILITYRRQEVCAPGHIRDYRNRCRKARKFG
uniref:Uncharacterized protein n=1 Tax=Glossina pallidipes TaxID=7398 RepID=A0A1B0ADJ3_GLOPL